MTTTDPFIDTSWIEAGAEVVVYCNDSRNPFARLTTIAKVAAKSFTVEDGTRFRIDRLLAREGGTWGWTTHVVPADSDTGRAELDKVRKRRLVNKARIKVDLWERNRTQDNRLAAIEALQEVQD